jgi:hypothetical protein
VIELVVAGEDEHAFRSRRAAIGFGGRSCFDIEFEEVDNTSPMRAFVEKRQAAQRAGLSRPTFLARRRCWHPREPGAILHVQRTLGNRVVQRLLESEAGAVNGGHTGGTARSDRDLSSLSRGSGESAHGSLNEGDEWIPATGNGGSASTAQAPAAGTAPPAAASVPRLKKTTVSALSTQRNGGFTWGVRWSIDNATTSTNGWIVQHVVVRQNVAAWHPPLLPSVTRPIVPGREGYGGLSTSWYPLWEAWQVRSGSVFVGGSTSVHSADTYGQNAVGENTKGTTEVVGRADFYPNLTLPTAFTVRNAAPAWSLPVTNTDPGLTGGTGALEHDLTANWDGVDGTGATTATTV